MRILTSLLICISFNCYSVVKPTVKSPCRAIKNACQLSDFSPVGAKLNEISGIVKHGNDLWVHNDGGNSNEIYRISADGIILQKVRIANAVNIDWEDITGSLTDLYIGDFGNNNGNRKDLCIYKVHFSDLTNEAVSVFAEKIHFAYDDQDDFTKNSYNSNYDCEAMIWYNDSLHLFSKRWGDMKTSHYILTDIPGVAIAHFKESFPAGFLVTGADILNGNLALVGYSKNIFSSIYFLIIDHFKGSSFFTGIITRFETGSMLQNGQVEGIALTEQMKGYIVNEKLEVSNVVAGIQHFDLTATTLQSINDDIKQVKLNSR
jgi:hypothetical protein